MDTFYLVASACRYLKGHFSCFAHSSDVSSVGVFFVLIIVLTTENTIFTRIIEPTT